MSLYVNRIMTGFKSLVFQSYRHTSNEITILKTKTSVTFRTHNKLLF